MRVAFEGAVVKGTEADLRDEEDEEGESNDLVGGVVVFGLWWDVRPCGRPVFRIQRV